MTPLTKICTILGATKKNTANLNYDMSLTLKYILISEMLKFEKVVLETMKYGILTTWYVAILH